MVSIKVDSNPFDCIAYKVGENILFSATLLCSPQPFNKIMTMYNPFNELNDQSEQSDAELVRMSQEGDRESLEHLITRHQPWIHNVALRMVSHPEDAEDITQEVLIKVITKLSTFQGKSQFRTWLYRIVRNSMLNMKTKRVEQFVTSFQQYGEGLDQIQNIEPSETLSTSPEFNILLEEAKLSCIHGMLLCLSREQRFIYILGCVFQVGDKIGSEIMELSRDNFRQKLSRARRDLHNFMNKKCGLINSDNPCRCHRKLTGFIKLGMVNKDRLLFNKNYVTKIKEVAKQTSDEFDEMADQHYPKLYQDTPMQNSPNFITALKEMLKNNPLDQLTS